MRLVRATVNDCDKIWSMQIEAFRDLLEKYRDYETSPGNEAKEKIESLGGKTTDSVTGKTNVVIVGTSPGSKYDKALKLGIEIWNEAQFLEKINN